jgi:formylglycine-generating enzyme required for sulfatase activity
MNTATLEKYLEASNKIGLLANIPNIKQCNPCRYIINELNKSEEPKDIYVASLAAVAPSNPLVFVQGGVLPANSELAGTKVADFEIGKFAVTMDEWTGVRDFAIAAFPGWQPFAQGIANSPKHPVTNISWYDAVGWCNAKSLMEGLELAYDFGQGKLESVLFKSNANGYRMPTEAEWEWAARGGKKSNGFTYAGSNDLNAVGWYKKNSGGAAHEVAKKAANELGLYDMSGNVWEWCEDVAYTSDRRIRGGGWSNSGVDYAAVAYRGFSGPGDRHDYIGFRLARSSGN